MAFGSSLKAGDRPRLILPAADGDSEGVGVDMKRDARSSQIGPLGGDVVLPPPRLGARADRAPAGP
jgi:hypothetical protein